MSKESTPIRVPRIAWVALVILAAVVVPLRVAEMYRQHQDQIFNHEKTSGAVLAPLQPTSHQ